MENKGFVRGVNMDEKRINLIKRLSKNRDFKAYQQMEEELLQSIATTLLSSNVSKEDGIDELMDAKGAYSFKKRMRELLKVKNQEEYD